MWVRTRTKPCTQRFGLDSTKSYGEITVCCYPIGFTHPSGGSCTHASLHRLTASKGFGEPPFPILS